MVAPSNPSYSSVDGVLFNKNQTTLIECPGGKSGSYTIPSGVTSIGAAALDHCTSLTSVTIPSSVTSIVDWAFEYCSSLKSVAFMGNAPLMGSSVFASTASGFTVYYFNGASGFTTPTWNDGHDTYPAVNMGAYSPAPPWLLRNGFAYNANLQSDPNNDGVSLLMAYALNLDPNRNLAGSMPQVVRAANQMSLIFYAGSAGVTYSVEASTDLKTWSTSGVTVSAPDANGFSTATVPTTGPRRFMRLKVVY
jgi:hypothetical protein